MSLSGACARSAKGDPVIGQAARIGAGLDPHPLDEPDTLARHGQRPGIFGRQIGEVDVETGRFAPPSRQ
jgi:hypothetical protein